jgi:2,4-dienoyl-CoA reductase-like NADH-dependent reductase (Old Yellow Enzyme family)
VCSPAISSLTTEHGLRRPILFEPLDLRGCTLPNRVVISPMQQNRAIDGMAQDWHFANLARYAMGGAGLVFVEAAAVEARGRVNHGDVGLWRDDQIAPLRRIADFVKAAGSVAGIQLGHAGRKGSTSRDYNTRGGLTASHAAKGEPPWETLSASAVPFADTYPRPVAMDLAQMDTVVEAFAHAALRALEAGFQVLEIHAAHGYLLHQFLSPLSNFRQDALGGDLSARMRFPLRVVEAVRAAWPGDRPLFVRLSAIDQVDAGLTLDDTIVIATALKALGVDVIDCSSAGNTPVAPPVYPGYQAPYAAAVRKAVGSPTMAVGRIMNAFQAEAILGDGSADLIAIARKAMDDPNFAIHARAALSDPAVA